MSTISVSIFLAILTAGCFASWKAALHWHNLTRDARKEDPRDQEIRELSAALSVSRKQVETLDGAIKVKAREAALLTEQVGKATDQLSNIQQKYSATKESLNHEFDSRENVDVELARLRRDLGIANTRLAELDVQAKIASPGSGLVAGMDDVVEDDEKEMFTIRHEHRELKQVVEVIQNSLDEQKIESARWKKHCAVMTATNKTLRSQVDELPKAREELAALREQVALLVATQAENRSLQVQIVELGDVKGENETLLLQVAKLDHTLKENSQLEELVQKQATELGSVRDDNDNLLSQVTSLNKVQDENQQMAALIAEQAVIVDDHARLQKQVAALRNIETENGALLAQIKELRQTGAEKLELAHAENAELQVRVEAIDKIQEENNRLLAQTQELRQSKSTIEALRGQLKEAGETNTENTAENTRLLARVAELGPVEQDNVQLRTNIDELKRAQQEQGKANNELGARIEKLALDLKDKEIQVAQINALLLERDDVLLLKKDENENLCSQVEQITLAHESLQTEAEALKLQLTEASSAQQDNKKLSAELDQLIHTLEQSQTEQAELKLQLAEAGVAQKENQKLEKEIVELTQAWEQLLSDNDELKQQITELDKTREEMGGLQKELTNLNHAQEEHLSRQMLIETELANEKDENTLLTEQLDKLSLKMEARKANQSAQDHVQTESRAIDCADSVAAGDATDSLPALQIEDMQDDLKSIRGVGAKIEQKLNMLGICNFKSLLQLEADDYERAAELIPNLEGRMQRDAWIDQARTLHLEKYNETI